MTRVIRTRQTLAALVAAAAFLLASNLQAGFSDLLEKIPFWPRHWPETLIVTGNYAKPRLLAELTQRKTDLPVLLISEEEQGDEIYYLPTEPEAMRIPARKYMEFVEVMMRPKRVVFLGGREYVDQAYVDKVQDNYSTIVISGRDWIKNARELGKLVGYGGLERQYRKQLHILLEAEAHTPESAGTGMPEILELPE